MKELFAVVLLASGLAAGRADQYFNLNLTGSQEVPANSSPGVGSGTAFYDSAANAISLSLVFSGLLAPATAAHIHFGGVGTNGPVIVSFVPFLPSATSGSIAGGPLPFPLAEVPSLLAGDTYFNIHTSVYPGGEIRGQLEPVPEPCGLALLGLAALVWRLRRA